LAQAILAQGQNVRGQPLLSLLAADLSPSFHPWAAVFGITCAATALLLLYPRGSG